jgi:hypothetical protein
VDLSRRPGRESFFHDTECASPRADRKYNRVIKYATYLEGSLKAFLLAASKAVVVMLSTPRNPYVRRGITRLSLILETSSWMKGVCLPDGSRCVVCA